MSELLPCYCHGDELVVYCPRHTPLPGEPSGLACKSCGDPRKPDTECSRCGGHGLVQSWDPIDCPSCGGSGIQWPPVCRGCSKYRSMKGWEAVLASPEART